MYFSLPRYRLKLKNKECSLFPSPHRLTHTHPKLGNYHIELKQQSALLHVTWPFQAKDSFVPLFAALNIAAVADNQQEEVGEESLLQ